MKKAVQILFLVFILSLQYAVVGAQQNLVPNPSFEDTVACPINGFITNCQGWEPYSSSPDYFNSCVPSWSIYSIPYNLHGFQLAASGYAYAGIYTYVEGETNYSIDREIIGQNLSFPLTIGTKYFVSFKSSLGTNTQNTGHSLATDKIGVLFSTVSYSNVDSTTIPPIENFAHVYSDSIITDTTNWTMVFGSFIADSAYTHISIGNFFKVSDTDTIHFTSNNPFTPNAYYFIDDICVSTDSSFCANYIFTGIDDENALNSFNIYPNPASDFITLASDEIMTEVFMLDITGKLVFSSKLNDRLLKINVKDYPSGFYIFYIETHQKIIKEKIVINH